MPNSTTNPPTFIEPPPPPPRAGLGCFGKSILAFILLALLLVVGIYFFVSRGLIASDPVQIPVQELPPEALSEVQHRVVQFQNGAATTQVPEPTVAPEATAAPDVTPTPAPPPDGRQLVLSAAEINGLIAANRKARGHASVSISGQTANIQISIPSDKVPTFPPGYLNGTFTITTNGPTEISGLQVSQIRANGYPIPSSILSMSYRGETLLSYALSGAAPYNVSTAEIRDGAVILR
ncbi:MAG: hypothetical protein H0X40_13505 [Chthoniobacterales bacterium]|nr:hypothetical protein [Chthoniobacterales bacterium]